MKEPDAIFIGDMHLREDQPVCRTDDFQKTFWHKVSYIQDLSLQFNCPVICSGDVFDHWKPSPNLLSLAIEHLPYDFHTIYGNHDLPQHSMELKYKCGLYTLATSNRVQIIDGLHWGVEEPEETFYIKDRKILVAHIGVYKGRLPYPGCSDSSTRSLLRKWPEYDVILTGHVHKPATSEMNGRILVNPGSISRQEADQKDFKPRVYFYYADTNTVEPHYLPIEDVVENVITRKHLQEKQEREDRINAFISRFDTDIQASISFRANVDKLIAQNKIRKSVKKTVYKILDND